MSQFDPTTSGEHEFFQQLQSLLIDSAEQPGNASETSSDAIDALINDSNNDSKESFKNTPESSASSEMGDGVALLQSILVHPELGEFRDQINVLERRCGELEQQLDQSTKLVKLLIPLISELLNRQSTQFKQDLTQSIQPVIDRLQIIEERLADQELSVRVTGIEDGDIPVGEAR